jgi:hypothetical protein
MSTKKRLKGHLRVRQLKASKRAFTFLDRPIAEQPIRDAFKLARQEAGLKPIRMYNPRHSFETALALCTSAGPG